MNAPALGSRVTVLKATVRSSPRCGVTTGAGCSSGWYQERRVVPAPPPWPTRTSTGAAAGTQADSAEVKAMKVAHALGPDSRRWTCTRPTMAFINGT